MLNQSPFNQSSPTNKPYVGRFAPTPSGSLHFGSLIAATASYLDAKANQGKWFLRIEDVDPPRTQASAIQSIIHTLESYHFEWDDEILYQSQRFSAYENVLKQLIADKKAYFCSCSKKVIKQTAKMGKSGLIYSGTCRKKLNNPESPLRSVRLLTNSKIISFIDGVQGRFQQNVEMEVGDFILKRSDNIYAYQLAAVVDDEFQNITNIVRGADLLDNTPRQIHLIKLLNYRNISYLHIPLAINSEGKKLSKQSYASEIKVTDKYKNIHQALIFLGQSPPPLNNFDTVDDLWKWAIIHWSINKIPKANSYVST